MYRYLAGLSFAITCMQSMAATPPLVTPTPQGEPYRQSAYPAYSIVGLWEYHAPQSSCVERYEFLADGNMRATSGKQVVDSTYTISDTHTPYAFYELKHQVVNANSEKDCDGERATAGYQGLHYVRYNTSGNSMVMCEDETAMLENCFGPLIKSK